MLKKIWKHLINQNEDMIVWFVTECLSEEDLQINYFVLKELLKESNEDFRVKSKMFRILMLIDSIMNSKGIILEK